MAISFLCGNCGKPFHVAPEMAGRTGRCKRCGHLLFIPFQSTDKPVRTWAPDPADEGDDAPTAPPPARSSPRKPAPGREAEPPPLPPRAGVAGPTSPAAPARARPKRRAKSKGSGRWNASPARLFWSACGVIALGLFSLRMINLVTGGAISAGMTRAIVARTTNQYDGKPIELPPLPAIGPGREIEPGVMFHEVVLGPANRSIGGRPGHGGKLWLYLPSQAAADHSLPCILIAGAGSPLIYGMALEEEDRASHLPFARAGFAVLAFELDGAVPNRDTASEQQIGKAAIRFLTARAGLVNAHIALEYALRQVPAVDPARISIAGHSSAGVLAVLFAETEPRLKSAVAFAPAVDVAKRFGPEQTAALQRSGLDDFRTRYSPINGVADLRCPLYLFQARDDDNTPAADADAFVARARAAGKEVTYDLVDRGGHAGALLTVGFPHAIAWLKGEPTPVEAEPAPFLAAPIPIVPRVDPPPPLRPRPVDARTTETQTTSRNGRRTTTRTERHFESRTNTPPPPMMPPPDPGFDPNSQNPVERERAAFEAAKRRRDEMRRRALGGGAPSSGDAGPP